MAASTWHWLDISGFAPCLVFLCTPQRRGEAEEKWCREAGRIEGRTLMSHFANSLQPTLPSQCYTYSTSPKALNSPLSLHRTNREKHTAFSTLWMNIYYPCCLNMESALCFPFSCDHSVINNYLQRKKYKHMSAGPAAVTEGAKICLESLSQDRVLFFFSFMFKGTVQHFRKILICFSARC